MEMVFISGSHKTRTDGCRNVYHTDRECHQLAHGVREISLGQAERMDLELCACCAGEVDRSHTGPTLANQIQNGEIDV